MTDAIAILPARGGSKRIPFKNGRAFCGRPMMGWPIQAARQSGLFSRIIVSTDDRALADIAVSEGAETPFLREPALADDFTPTRDVIADAIDRLALPPDTVVVCIYPTSVFLRAQDLETALDRLRGGAGVVLSLGEFPAPIDRAYRRTATGFAPRDRLMMPRRSQDLEAAYFDAAQFYAATADRWRDPVKEIWDEADAVVLPRNRCVDIDTPEDWEMAEALFRLQRG